VLCRRERASRATATPNAEPLDAGSAGSASALAQAAPALPNLPSEARQQALASERAPRRLDIQVPRSVLLVPIVVLGVYFVSAAMARSSRSASTDVAASAERQAGSAENPNTAASVSSPNAVSANALSPSALPSSASGRSAASLADGNALQRREAGRQPAVAPGSERSRAVAARADRSARAEELAARHDAQARELAAARENVEVTVYFAEWCPACRAVRRYLGERNIRSVEYDVDKDRSAASRYRVLNPRNTIPTLDIEGQVLVGFDPQSIQGAIDRAARSRLARLDGTF
jgi:glutaredoxin 3